MLGMLFPLSIDSSYKVRLGKGLFIGCFVHAFLSWISLSKPENWFEMKQFCFWTQDVYLEVRVRNNLSNTRLMLSGGRKIKLYFPITGAEKLCY